MSSEGASSINTGGGSARGGTNTSIANSNNILTQGDVPSAPPASSNLKTAEEILACDEFPLEDLEHALASPMLRQAGAVAIDVFYALVSDLRRCLEFAPEVSITRAILGPGPCLLKLLPATTKATDLEDMITSHRLWLIGQTSKPAVDIELLLAVRLYTVEEPVRVCSCVNDVLNSDDRSDKMPNIAPYMSLLMKGLVMMEQCGCRKMVAKGVVKVSKSAVLPEKFDKYDEVFPPAIVFTGFTRVFRMCDPVSEIGDSAYLQIRNTHGVDVSSVSVVSNENEALLIPPSVFGIVEANRSHGKFIVVLHRWLEPEYFLYRFAVDGENGDVKSVKDAFDDLHDNVVSKQDIFPHDSGVAADAIAKSVDTCDVESNSEGEHTDKQDTLHAQDSYSIECVSTATPVIGSGSGTDPLILIRMVSELQKRMQVSSVNVRVRRLTVHFLHSVVEAALNSGTVVAARALLSQFEPLSTTLKVIDQGIRIELFKLLVEVKTLLEGKYDPDYVMPLSRVKAVKFVIEKILTSKTGLEYSTMVTRGLDAIEATIFVDSRMDEILTDLQSKLGQAGFHEVKLQVVLASDGCPLTDIREEHVLQSGGPICNYSPGSEFEGWVPSGTIGSFVGVVNEYGGGGCDKIGFVTAGHVVDQNAAAISQFGDVYRPADKSDVALVLLDDNWQRKNDVCTNHALFSWVGDDMNDAYHSSVTDSDEGAKQMALPRRSPSVADSCLPAGSIDMSPVTIALPGGLTSTPMSVISTPMTPSNEIRTPCDNHSSFHPRSGLDSMLDVLDDLDDEIVPGTEVYKCGSATGITSGLYLGPLETRKVNNRNPVEVVAWFECHYADNGDCGAVYYRKSYFDNPKVWKNVPLAVHIGSARWGKHNISLGAAFSETTIFYPRDDSVIGWRTVYRFEHRHFLQFTNSEGREPLAVDEDEMETNAPVLSRLDSLFGAGKSRASGAATA